MNVWPTTLPQRSQRPGYSRAMGDARQRTPTDAGPGKTRRRLSFVPDPTKAVILMSTEQREIFEHFTDETLDGGTLPFLFPAIDQDGTWIVKLGETMPNWTERSAGMWLVVLDLVKLGRGPFAIKADQLPVARQGVSFEPWRPATVNGTKPIVWSITGALPEGLIFDAATGAIGGTPVKGSNTLNSFVVRATDLSGKVATFAGGLQVRWPAVLYVGRKNARQVMEMTSSRTTTASYIGADGLIKIAAIGEPRFEYDPTTLEYRGLLSEPARTRSNTYPISIENWLKSANTTVSVATDVMAPDGTYTARNIEGSGQGGVYVETPRVAKVTTNHRTRSVYVKAGSYRYVRLSKQGAENAQYSVLLDTQTGVTTSDAVRDVYIFYGAEDAGNGWWRLWIYHNGTPEAAGYLGSVAVFLTNYIGTDNEGYNTAGNYPAAGQNVYLWFGQMEAGVYPTSPIFGSETTAVTRSADIPEFLVANIPGYNPNAGTLVMDGAAPDFDSTTTYVGFQLYGPAATNYAGFTKNDTGTRNSRLGTRLRSTTAYTAEQAVEKTFPVLPNSKRVAMTWDTTGLQYVSEASGVVSANIATPNWTGFTYQKLQFAEGFGRMYYKAGVYIAERISAADLLAEVTA